MLGIPVDRLDGQGRGDRDHRRAGLPAVGRGIGSTGAAAGGQQQHRRKHDNTQTLMEMERSRHGVTME